MHGTKRMLGSRLWNGFRLPIPWHKIVIRNIFDEVKLALMYFKGMKPSSREND